MRPKTKRHHQTSADTSIPFRYASLLLLLVLALLQPASATAALTSSQSSHDSHTTTIDSSPNKPTENLLSVVGDTANSSADIKNSTLACATCPDNPIALGDITLTALVIYAFIYIALGSIRILRLVKSSLLVFISTSLAAGPVVADVHRALYLGMGTGMSHLTPAVENGEVTDRDKQGRLLNGYLGYELNEKMSVELNYAELGKASLKPLGSVDYQDINISGVYHINGAATSRKQKPYSLYGRLGIGTIQTQSDLRIEREHNAHWLAGAGIQMPVTDRFAVRAEGTYHDSDVSSVGVSLLYRIMKPGAGKSSSLINAASDKTDDSSPMEHPASSLAVNTATMNTDTPDMSFERDQGLAEEISTPQGTTPDTPHWLLNADANTDGQEQADVLEITPDSGENPDSSLQPLGISLAASQNDTPQEGDMELAAAQTDTLNMGIEELSATSLNSEQAEDPSISTIDMSGNNAPEIAAAMPEVTEENAVESNEGSDSAYEPVLFEFDSNDITMYGKEQLVPLVQYLSSEPNRQVILTGHTDDLGPEEYNQHLSQLRAEAVKKFLLQQGIDRKMIKTIGAGEKNPLKSNRTATGRMNNRRVEIVVV